MEISWNVCVLYWIIMLVSIEVGILSAEGHCSPGKFGVGCQYGCHCEGGCDENFKSCESDCQLGWSGPTCQIRNIPVNQRLTNIRNAGSPYPPGYAKKTVDGDISTCIHANATGGTERLRIELNSISHIKYIRMINTQKLSRNERSWIKDMEIRVGNTSTISKGRICSKFKDKFPEGVSLTVDCVETGKFIWFIKRSTPYRLLSLCEVQFFGTGCSEYTWGKDCAEFCGKCKNGLTCNEVTGACPGNQCQVGWTGTRCDAELPFTMGLNEESISTGKITSGFMTTEFPTKPIISDIQPTEYLTAINTLGNSFENILTEISTEYTAAENSTEYMATEYMTTEYMATKHPTEYMTTDKPTQYMATEISKELIETENPTEYMATEQVTENTTTENPSENMATHNLTEYMATENPTEYMTTENSTEYMTTENPTEYMATKNSTEYMAAENSTEYMATENPTEYMTTENPTEYMATENPTEYMTTENPTEYMATENPTEYMATENPTEYMATENPTEYMTTENPTEYMVTEYIATNKPTEYIATETLTDYMTTARHSEILTTAYPSESNAKEPMNTKNPTHVMPTETLFVESMTTEITSMTEGNPTEPVSTEYSTTILPAESSATTETMPPIAGTKTAWTAPGLIVQSTAKVIYGREKLRKKEKPALCSLKADIGYPCTLFGEKTNMVWRYYFDSGVCFTSIYRGCGGNQNRFTSRRECELACFPPTTVKPTVTKGPATNNIKTMLSFTKDMSVSLSEERSIETGSTSASRKKSRYTSIIQLTPDFVSTSSSHWKHSQSTIIAKNSFSSVNREILESDTSLYHRSSIEINPSKSLSHDDSHLYRTDSQSSELQTSSYLQAVVIDNRLVSGDSSLGMTYDLALQPSQLTSLPAVSKKNMSTFNVYNTIEMTQPFNQLLSSTEHRLQSDVARMSSVSSYNTISDDQHDFQSVKKWMISSPIETINRQMDITEPAEHYSMTSSVLVLTSTYNPNYTIKDEGQMDTEYNISKYHNSLSTKKWMMLSTVETNNQEVDIKMSTDFELVMSTVLPSNPSYTDQDQDSSDRTITPRVVTNIPKYTTGDQEKTRDQSYSQIPGTSQLTTSVVPTVIVEVTGIRKDSSASYTTTNIIPITIALSGIILTVSVLLILCIQRQRKKKQSIEFNVDIIRDVKHSNSPKPVKLKARDDVFNVNTLNPRHIRPAKGEVSDTSITSENQVTMPTHSNGYDEYPHLQYIDVQD